MIQVINGKSEAPNIEAISIAGDFYCDLQYSDLDAAEKLIYDAGALILAPSTLCNLININDELSIERITSVPFNQGDDEITTTELDYLTLSASDKTDVDAFIALLAAKCW